MGDEGAVGATVTSRLLALSAVGCPFYSYRWRDCLRPMLEESGEPMAEEMTRADLLNLQDLLEEVWDFLDTRMDGEYTSDGVPTGNRASRLAQDVAAVLEKLERVL